MKNHVKTFQFITSYKALIDDKPLCIKFDKVDGFIRFYDGTRYLVSFGTGLDIL